MSRARVRPLQGADPSPAWDFDDPAFDSALDIEFDADGNLVQRGGSGNGNHIELAVEDEPVVIAGDGRGDDSETAFTAAQMDPREAAAAQVLTKKLKFLLKQRSEYQMRIKKLLAAHKAKDLQLNRLEEDLQKLIRGLEQREQAHVPSFFTSAADRQEADSSQTVARRREEAKRQLISAVDIIQEEEYLGEELDLKWYQHLWLKFKMWLQRRYPFQKILRTVESRYGSSVAAYFTFFRWIIMNFFVVALVGLFFFVKHLYLGSFEWSDFVNLYLPVVLFQSSYTTNEALDYAGFLLLVIIILVFFALRKWIHEDFRLKTFNSLVGTGDTSKECAQTGFMIWDFSSSSLDDIRNQLLFNGEQVDRLLAEHRLRTEARRRKCGQRLKVFARRATGLLLSIALQGAAAFLIIQLTITSSSLEESIRNSSISFLSPIAGAVVPAAVSIINVLQPPIITALSKFEGWESGGSAIKWLVWRLFLAKLLNVLIQVLSYAELADPYLFRGRTFGFTDSTFLKSVRDNTAVEFSPSAYTCRADQAGSGLLQLVIIEFVVSKVVLFTVPLMKRLVKRIMNKPRHKGEFMVAKSMASMLYFTQLGLLAIPYAPLSVLLTAAMMALNFLYEYWILKHFFQKPRKPWSAKDAGSFFVKFYLISLVFFGIGNVGFVANRSFPKDCDVMTGVINDLYSGVDPYCTALEERSYLIDVADSNTRLDEYGQVGGEVLYWMSDECPTQCTSAEAAAVDSGSTVSCVERCSSGYKLSLDCDTTSASISNDILVGANITKPCDFPCGPFIEHETVYQSVEAVLLSGDVLSVIYNALVDPLVVWIMCVCVLIFACFKWNTLNVVVSARSETDSYFRELLESYRRRERHKDRRIQVLQSIQEQNMKAAMKPKKQ